ncbi:MAG TPA: hypothetical protein VFS05_11035 [Gemmatimonadaceae bacterium]|nr:hypothetical protein [Gemmatimonadaceae bacterium]
MTSRRALSLLLAVVVAVSVPVSPALAQSPAERALAVPTGRAVLPDGRVEPGEWRDALEVTAAPDVKLYIKRDSLFLYIAVVRETPRLFGVNLYLGAPGAAEYLNLHASAKLGERTGRGGAWPEWAWWNNAGWAANVGRIDTFEPRRFLVDEAKEFQIRLHRLPAGELALGADLEGTEGVTPLFTKAPARDGLHWITLRL